MFLHCMLAILSTVNVWIDTNGCERYEIILQQATHVHVYEL